VTHSTAHGGNATGAFDLVIPSLPGYGFSGTPTTTGWKPTRITRAWVVLITKVLGIVFSGFFDPCLNRGSLPLVFGIGKQIFRHRIVVESQPIEC
jgi:hypothetical protein